MLPGIFLQDDPILEMRLPVETREELEALLERLPAHVVRSEDALGWVYQYWQAKRKDEVNKSERKIGGADLAPVTQLFTEDYMVRFLLENSLGAWWARRHPDSPLLATWEFLRRHEDGSPAVGGFEGWPERVSEVTVMDPCCGSGHFLVAAFGMLWRMRAEEEGLDPVAAQDAVLRDNLFGLELDPRCTQIAVFALCLEAWKAGGFRVLPLPNVACCGIPARAPLSDWLALAGGDPWVEATLSRLHNVFAHADTLGSLIDPVRAAEQAGLDSVDWHMVAPLVDQALSQERGPQSADPAAAVFGEAAAGIARAADLLAGEYSLVVTNPPFLGRNRQSGLMAEYLAAEYPDSSMDLAFTIYDRWRSRTRDSARAVVLPHTWLFLGATRRFRETVLTRESIALLARLGAGAFSSISGEVVQVSLHVSSTSEPSIITQIDASTAAGISGKCGHLKEGKAVGTDAAEYLRIPDVRLTFGTPSSLPLLSDIADAFAGIQTGDGPRFIRSHWELPRFGDRWERIQGSSDGAGPWRGRENVLRWDEGQGALHDFVQEKLGGSTGAWIRGLHLKGTAGVAVNVVGLRSSIYAGDLYDCNIAVVSPRNPDHLAALFTYISSDEYRAAVQLIDAKPIKTNRTLVKVPFDLGRWQAAARDQFPAGLPLPNLDDPTQWLFTGAVERSRHPLQVAVARLVGHKWPDQKADDLDALADTDGLVCLPALGGEATAEERLRELLAAAYGSSWSPKALDALLVDAGGKLGAGGLGKWLRDGFFKDHCKVFANRPFIWQIWDGRPDGFSVLVNYHKLDRRLLERLTYDYLGSWWTGRLNDEVRQQLPGAEGRLVAAEQLKAKLELILEGEPPYDIYVRWKSLAEQPLGWAPDLDDGVRLNIRPFMTAGVLRTKPNIKWEKDRGKNPDGSERLNDLHYTLAQKRAARGDAGQ